MLFASSVIPWEAHPVGASIKVCAHSKISFNVAGSYSFFCITTLILLSKLVWHLGIKIHLKAFRAVFGWGHIYLSRNGWHIYLIYNGWHYIYDIYLYIMDDIYFQVGTDLCLKNHACSNVKCVLLVKKWIKIFFFGILLCGYSRCYYAKQQWFLQPSLTFSFSSENN